MEKFINENRQAAISILSIFTMLVVLFFGGTNIYGRISDIVRKIDKANGELNSLENKAEILSDAQVNSISDLANEANVALPTYNPTLPLVINVRRINDEIPQMVVKTMEVGTQSVINGKSSFYTTVLKIEATGTLLGLSSFVQEVSQIKPVTNIKALSVRHNYNSSTLDAEIELISFWSPLPTELSSVSQTIAGLTSNEEQVLGLISQFSSPVFTGSNVDTEFTPRANPFVFGEVQ